MGSLNQHVLRGSVSFYSCDLCGDIRAKKIPMSFNYRQDYLFCQDCTAFREQKGRVDAVGGRIAENKTQGSQTANNDLT